MSEHHEGKRWLDVKGGPHDGSEVELSRGLSLGSAVAIVTGEGGGLEVVEIPHLRGVAELPPGPLYVLRGFGLEFLEHRDEEANK